MDSEEALTPAQRRVTDDLMARDQPRPQFDRSLGDDLRAHLEATLAPLTEALDEPIHVSKNALSAVHMCEANYLAELDWSGWNAANAEGVVTHRAVQLSITLGDGTPPLLLVDHAIEELMADEASQLGSFLHTIPPPSRAELRGRAGNAVATFLECWPPIKSSWYPRTELPVRVDLCDGRIVLRGKIDLALGRARGDEARCLFVDLKTGNHYSSHLDDLRFYALIQAIRIGVPPYRVASYYLESAGFAAEDVTEETLEIALHRTEAGVTKMIELRAKQREAAVTPCPRCRYCRLRTTCDGARQWEARDQEDA
ncbi:MAG: PD-(D/E)XK nuclease family protein [Acidimicrobiales bacterium]